VGRVARRRLRALLLAATGVLYALSIPWYRTGGEAAGVALGLPDWVAVALGCYAGAALLNATAWLVTDFPDADPTGKERSEDRNDAEGGS